MNEYPDDRTILNMMTNNKDFNDLTFFRKVIEEKYPSLKIFKQKHNSWKDFYIKMVFYISKLYEELGIKYRKEDTYNPEDFYNEMKESQIDNKTGKDIADYTEEEMLILTEGKIVLIVNGCFCPPHAGHYNLVNNVIDEINPDIVIINTTNKSNPEYARHGVSKEFTIETWKSWGNILSKKYGVDVMIIDDISSRWRWFSSKTKEIINLNVHEQDMPNKFIKNLKEKMDVTGLSLGFFQKVPRDHLYKYHVQRKGDLSATEFTKCLKNFLKDCYEFVPDDVIDKKSYINNIREKYGKYLK